MNRPTITVKTWNRSRMKAEAPISQRSEEVTTKNKISKDKHLKKGTFFECGEKWNSDYQSPSKKVFMINSEDIDIPGKEEVELSDTQDEAKIGELLNIDTENVQISLQTITREITTSQTLHFQKTIREAKVAMLRQR